VLSAVSNSGTAAALEHHHQQQQTAASIGSIVPQSLLAGATPNSTEDIAAGVLYSTHRTHRSLQAARHLQGVPKNALQFTGVRLESSVKAKASMVSGRIVMSCLAVR
jgi:hypothetical protein